MFAHFCLKLSLDDINSIKSHDLRNFVPIKHIQIYFSFNSWSCEIAKDLMGQEGIQWDEQQSQLFK